MTLFLKERSLRLDNNCCVSEYWALPRDLAPIVQKRVPSAQERLLFSAFLAPRQVRHEVSRSAE